MKWFKHLVDSGDDPDVGAIMEEFGFKGYYIFFRTLEIMSREFDISSPGEIRCKLGWLLGRYRRRITKKLVLNFFEFTSQLGRFEYEINGNDIWVKCDKLKELTDEYTSKQLKRLSGFNPEKIQKKSKKNPHKEERSKNKDIKKRPNKYSDAHLSTAKYLAERIRDALPRHRLAANHLDNWANTFRLMDEKGEATMDEVRHLIDWIFADSFWSSNILSADKLREKFGRLWEDAKKGSRNREHRPSQIGRSTAAASPDELSRRQILIDLRTELEPDLRKKHGWEVAEARARKTGDTSELDSIAAKIDLEISAEYNRRLDA